MSYTSHANLYDPLEKALNSDSFAKVAGKEDKQRKSFGFKSGIWGFIHPSSKKDDGLVSGGKLNYRSLIRQDAPPSGDYNTIKLEESIEDLRKMTYACRSFVAPGLQSLEPRHESLLASKFKTSVAPPRLSGITPKDAEEKAKKEATQRSLWHQHRQQQQQLQQQHNMGLLDSSSSMTPSEGASMRSRGGLVMIKSQGRSRCLSLPHYLLENSNSCKGTDNTFDSAADDYNNSNNVCRNSNSSNNDCEEDGANMAGRCLPHAQLPPLARFPSAHSALLLGRVSPALGHSLGSFIPTTTCAADGHCTSSATSASMQDPALLPASWQQLQAAKSPGVLLPHLGTRTPDQPLEPDHLAHNQPSPQGPLNPLSPHHPLCNPKCSPKRPSTLSPLIHSPVMSTPQHPANMSSLAHGSPSAPLLPTLSHHPLGASDTHSSNSSSPLSRFSHPLLRGPSTAAPDGSHGASRGSLDKKYVHLKVRVDDPGAVHLHSMQSMAMQLPLARASVPAATSWQTAPSNLIAHCVPHAPLNDGAGIQRSMDSPELLGSSRYDEQKRNMLGNAGGGAEEARTLSMQPFSSSFGGNAASTNTGGTTAAAAAAAAQDQHHIEGADATATVTADAPSSAGAHEAEDAVVAAIIANASQSQTGTSTTSAPASTRRKANKRLLGGSPLPDGTASPSTLSRLKGSLRTYLSGNRPDVTQMDKDNYIHKIVGESRGTYSTGRYGGKQHSSGCSKQDSNVGAAATGKQDSGKSSSKGSGRQGGKIEAATAAAQAATSADGFDAAAAEGSTRAGPKISSLGKMMLQYKQEEKQLRQIAMASRSPGGMAQSKLIRMGPPREWH